jgi:hypothetical protein
MEPIDFIHKEGGGIDYEATLRLALDQINHHELRWKQLDERMRRASVKMEEAGMMLDED